MGFNRSRLAERETVLSRCALPLGPPHKLMVADQTSAARPSMTLGGAPVDSFLGRWFVANVKWREEKAFADAMVALDVPYFLPLKRCKDRWRNVVWLALFPSYVFFCGGDTERFKVIDCGLCISKDPVKSVLSCVRQGQLRDDLGRIYQQQLAKPDMIDTYKPGAPVRVKLGPWEGREGFIELDTGKPFIIFRSEIFGQSSVAFEVDRNDVEPL